MLIGTFQLELDDTKSVLLPEAWRSSFARGLVLTHGLEQNLFAFPTSAFKKIAEEIGLAGIEPIDARDWSRFFLGSAAQLTLSKSGRLAIPQTHISYAELAREVTLVGTMNRIEIWAANKYEAYEKTATRDIAQIAERFDKLARSRTNRQET
jgi:MraZ protein